MNKQAEEKRELFHEWSNLEDKLIEGIAETGNQDLMDTFIDWQNKRQLLNKEWNDFIEQLKASESESTLSQKQIEFIEWTHSTPDWYPDEKDSWVSSFEYTDAVIRKTTPQLFDHWNKNIKGK